MLNYNILNLNKFNDKGPLIVQNINLNETVINLPFLSERISSAVFMICSFNKMIIDYINQVIIKCQVIIEKIIPIWLIHR